MTAEEIRRSVRLAKNPKEQLRILADLNAVRVEVIEDIVSGRRDDLEIADKKPADSGAPNKSKWYWTTSEIDQLKEMRLFGVPAAEIAARLGRPFGATKKKLVQLANDGEIPKKRTVVTNDIIDNVTSMWMKGYSRREIAETLGTKRTTTNAIIRRIQ